MVGVQMGDKKIHAMKIHVERAEIAQQRVSTLWTIETIVDEQVTPVFPFPTNEDAIQRPQRALGERYFDAVKGWRQFFNHERFLPWRKARLSPSTGLLRLPDGFLLRTFALNKLAD